MIARWIAVNVTVVVIIAVWAFSKGYDSSYVLIGKIIAQAAFMLYLINLNMYFVFLLIRKSTIRDVKVKLAKISKKMMKYHIPFAITASLLIGVHAVIMAYVRREDFWIWKTGTGVLSLIILAVLLYSGLSRHRKATGRRRRFHYGMAFVFFSIVILHVFL